MSARSAKVEIRVTPAEKEAWAAAAGGTRKVSEWLRALANGEAREPRGGDLVGPVEALDAAGLELPPAPRTFAETKQKFTQSQSCPRWMHHRPGVYCGSCGKVQ